MIRFNIKHLAFQAIFFFLLLQQVLLNYSSGVINTAFSYTDEALTCVFVIVILFRYNRFGKVLCRQERIMLVFFCVFIAFAGISNILYPLQSVFLNVSDLIVCSRFIIIYLAIRILFPDRNKSAKLLLSLSGPCKVLISITFIFLVHDVFFTPIFPKSDYRYFMNSLQLFYGLPTNMSSACATCAFVLIAAMSVSKKEKDHNPLFIAMALLSVALTLRSKAIGGMACVLFIYVVYVKYRFRSIFFGFFTRWSNCLGDWLGATGLLFWTWKSGSRIFSGLTIERFNSLSNTTVSVRDRICYVWFQYRRDTLFPSI